jgi:hypothetical protein
VASWIKGGGGGLQTEQQYATNKPSIYSTNKHAGQIQLLPADALTGHPPAWKHYQQDNARLHLMGEGTLFRARVFKPTYTQVCNARSGGVLERQVGGVTAQLLRQYARCAAVNSDADMCAEKCTERSMQHAARQHQRRHWPLCRLSSTSSDQQVTSRREALLVEQVAREAISIREAVSLQAGLTQGGASYSS